eukprot:scaffold714_cov121-Isochrysis_galbana.AAC.23
MPPRAPPLPWRRIRRVRGRYSARPIARASACRSPRVHLPTLLRPPALVAPPGTRPHLQPVAAPEPPLGQQTARDRARCRGLARHARWAHLVRLPQTALHQLWMRLVQPSHRSMHARAQWPIGRMHHQPLFAPFRQPLCAPFRQPLRAPFRRPLFAPFPQPLPWPPLA